MNDAKHKSNVNFAEADPAVPGATPERRLVGLHATGPRVPKQTLLPPVCVPAAQGN